MTEQEWLACRNPKTLLCSLFARSRGKGKPEVADLSEERFRLFAIACCRRVAQVLEFGDTYALDCLEIYTRKRLREALMKARRFRRPAGTSASNGLSNVDRTNRTATFLAQARSLASSAVWSCTKSKPTQAAMGYHEAAQAAESIRLADDHTATPKLPGPNWQPPSIAELTVQCHLLRDIFGNPFRPVVFDPAWRSDTALSLAKHIYESRDFSAMPILADALQEAGCEGDEILTHCRDESLTHVRGCWVVDLVLGKE